jgi:hypothetical protein
VLDAMLDQVEQHFILFSILFFLVGSIVGYLLSTKDRQPKEETVESFFSQNKKTKRKQKQDKPNIVIDDSTHVVSIKTEGLEKRYEEIANNQTKPEDISGSINKLKGLKQKE